MVQANHLYTRESLQDRRLELVSYSNDEQLSDAEI